MALAAAFPSSTRSRAATLATGLLAAWLTTAPGPANADEPTRGATPAVPNYSDLTFEEARNNRQVQLADQIIQTAQNYVVGKSDMGIAVLRGHDTKYSADQIGNLLLQLARQSATALNLNVRYAALDRTDGGDTRVVIITKMGSETFNAAADAAKKMSSIVKELESFSHVSQAEQRDYLLSQTP